ncbi:Putative NADP-dependent oxidoreductase YfmJ [Achromobacter piechaudii]|uniref:NADP-dependent oxidoreductase YfmJ n=2 Tax=Achromobacter piechaudii TaxID=72556 RepID=A0A6S7D5R7_9BURK|nr:Putative NADP-dependent oxidoreductase YfmJ [Achromobacter piechaudii]
MPELGPGQILVRTQWLSVDPYMRGRLNPASMKLGALMQGGGVGEVVASNHPGWDRGDLAEAPDVGWQEYAVLTPDLPGAAKVNKVDVGRAPAQAALSWLGMPGLTAYFAMLEVGRPKVGDVVVVSAAAGAVGQIAGQLAKLGGCRVIGIAGSEEKLAWCREIGFDDTINYRAEEDLRGAIARRCPNGVNVFFDGTGGAIHDAVLMNLALNARVAVVGKIAVANNAADQDQGLRASARLIATRASLQGFVVYDWWHRRDEALSRLAAWGNDGTLKFKEDVIDGFLQVPQAYLRMMQGENLGKQLVRL